MKLLIYIHDLLEGGAQKAFVNLANELADNGVEVAIATLDTGVISNQLSSSVELYVLNSDRTLLSFREFNRVVKAFNATHLYTGLLQNNIFLAMYKILFHYKGKVFLSEHSIPSLIPKSQLGLVLTICTYLRPYLYRLADKIVAVSESCKNDLVKNIGLPSNKVVRIYNPIYTNASDVPQNFSVDKNELNFAFIGRLHKIKRIDLLLEAFSLVVMDRPSKLYIMGIGEEKVRLKNIAAKLDILGSVVFLGYVDNPAAYLQCMDCLVLTSEIEGFGNVVVESLMVGVKVVSTPSLGPEEIITDECYGRICEANARSVADAMLLVSNDRSQFDFPAEKFSISVVVEEYREMFQDGQL